MAPLKLDDNIREKLQERELKPAKTAWKKLEAQLDAQEDRGGKTFLWLAIAASITALLVIGSLVYQPTSTTTEIVAEENPSENVELENNSEIIPQELPAEEIAREAIQPEEKTSEKVTNKKAVQLQKNRQNKLTEAVALVEKQEIEKKSVQELDNVIQDNSFEDKKVEEVVARLKEIQQSNSSISIDEVEALLAAAQRDIKTQRFLNKNTQKVDATALLMDVEFELERGFRDKVFDALGDGFQKIRTAVTERNN